MVILFVELHISVHFSKCIILHDKKVRERKFQDFKFKWVKFKFQNI